jgi:hypothetical protein
MGMEYITPFFSFFVGSFFLLIKQQRTDIFLLNSADSKDGNSRLCIL